MSILAASDKGLPNKVLRNDQSVYVPVENPSTNLAASYTRPADWISLGSITSSDQKMIGLFAVPLEAGYAAVSANVALSSNVRIASTYDVNWGDGTSNLAVSGTSVVYHRYDYNAVTPQAGDAALGYRQALITITPASGDLLTEVSIHNKYILGNVVTGSMGVYSSGFLDVAFAGNSINRLLIGTSTFGVATTTITQNHLEQVTILSSDLKNVPHLFYNCSSLQSVPTLALSSDAALRTIPTTSVTTNVITSAAHGLTNFTPVTVNTAGSSGLTLNNTYYVINPTANTFQLSATDRSAVVAAVTSVTGLVLNNLTVVNNMFNNCSSLQTAPSFDTSACRNFSSAFSACGSLRSIPTYDTSAGALLTSMFATCSALPSIPAFNFTKATDTSSMFNGCYGLRSVPALSFPLATTTGSMFINCRSLVSVGMLDMPLATTLTSMFSGCSSLQSIAAFNAPAASANFTNMFFNCIALQTVPLFNMVGGTNFTSMFQGCTNLQTIPAFNLAAITGIYSGGSGFGMFQGCFNLREIPPNIVLAGTFCFNMFRSCTSLVEVPALSLPNATNLGGMFDGCTALQSVQTLSAPKATTLTGMLQNCDSLTRIAPMSFPLGTALGSMFASCKSLIVAPNINMPAATSTASMFTVCASLRAVPAYDMSAVTDFSSMFNACSALELTPAFIMPSTGSATNFSSMFASCSRLQEVALFDTSSGSNFTSMFSACYSLQSVPSFNTANGITFSSMFTNCSSLKELPTPTGSVWDTSKGTTFTNMFSTCNALQNPPAFNFINATAVGGFLFTCPTVVTSPAYNMPKVTTVDSMFATSPALRNVGNITLTSNCVTFTNMFNGCSMLKTIPNLVTTGGTTFTTMFSGCPSLEVVPALALSTATVATSIFGANTNASLRSINATGLKLGTTGTVSYSLMKLGRLETENILTNLGRATTPAAPPTYGISFAGNPVGTEFLSNTRVSTITTGNANITSVTGSTVNYAVGHLVTGTGISDSRTVQGWTNNNRISTANHQFPANTEVSFALVNNATTTAAGITTYTRYYTQNESTNDFQLVTSLLGNTAANILTITSNTTATTSILFGTFITSIGVYGVNTYQVSIPPISNGTPALTVRALNTSIASLKGWLVST